MTSTEDYSRNGTTLDNKEEGGGRVGQRRLVRGVAKKEKDIHPQRRGWNQENNAGEEDTEND